MTDNEFYILGAGGQARQVLSISHCLRPPLHIRGFIDINVSESKFINGIPVIDETKISALDKKNTVMINGMGRPDRKKAIENVLKKGFRFERIIHPAASVGEFVNIGDGTIIQAGVGIMTNVELGNFLLIDLNATIGHDVIIGDYTTISTGVNIAGGASVGKGSWIGSGSVILENVSIGNNTLIGAGSVVTRDVDDNKLAYGIPAKVIKNISDVSSTLRRNKKN